MAEIRRNRLSYPPGFALVEVLVAAVIFAGVFLMLFALLGRVISHSSGADQLRTATIAELHLARFHEKLHCPEELELVELDGIQYRVTTQIQTSDSRETLRLTIGRASSEDTLAIFYGIRYVSKD